MNWFELWAVASLGLAPVICGSVLIIDSMLKTRSKKRGEG